MKIDNKTLTWLVTLGFYFIIDSFWKLLEIIFYGSIQPRIVDDLVCLMFLPFVYYTSYKIINGKSQ